MKSLGDIILITAFCFIMLYGLVLISNQAGANNSLDQESLDIISRYDTEYVIFEANITNQYNSNKGLTDYDTDSNDVGTEAKEFFETKDKVNQIRSTAQMALNLPDILFLAIPFASEEDLTIYRIVLGLLLVIAIFIALIAALFGKFWGSQS